MTLTLPDTDTGPATITLCIAIFWAILFLIWGLLHNQNR